MRQQPSATHRAGFHGGARVGWCGVLTVLGCGLASLASCASAALPAFEQEASHLDGGIFDLASNGDASTIADLVGADLAGVDLASLDSTTSHDMATNGCGVSSLKVNEVSTSGPGGATDEYVELYNPCANSVALSGARVAYRSASGTTDTSPLVVFTTQSIAAHGYVLIANTGYGGTADVKPFATGATGLADAGGGIALEDASSTRVDSLGWGTATNAFVETAPVGAPGATKSAARTPNGTDTNNNVDDFKLATRTPGAAN